MHLCQPCAHSIQDWSPAPTVSVPAINPHDPRNAGERQSAQRPMCPSCRARALGDRRLKTCETCAVANKFCQHCGASTISQEERDREERGARLLDGVLDLFTVLVKTYGYTDARTLLDAHADRIEGSVEVALTHRLEDLDARIQHRAGLRELFGQLRSRSRGPVRCEACYPPSRRAPAMSKADGCGHWTHGIDMAWCLFCALESEFCANCGVNKEPVHAESDGD